VQVHRAGELQAVLCMPATLTVADLEEVSHLLAAVRV
jgi:hypothetical protein